MASDPATRLATLQGGGPRTESLVLMCRDGEAVIGEATLPGGRRLDLEATNLRNDRTGLHACVRIRFEGGFVGQNSFNVERDAERVRFANSCADQAGDKAKLGRPFKMRLDEFCCEMWSTWVMADVPEVVTAAEPAGIDWLVEPFVARGAGTIVYGPPKACKSWLAMLWSAAVMGARTPWASRQGRVLFVNLERPAHTLRGRLWCIERATGHSPRMRVFNRRGGSLASVAPAIRRHLGEDDLIVVDSLSRSGTGDLNANDAANEAMDMLNSFGVAWCILAHTPRADTSHTYGSVMFEAAADLLVGVTSVLGSDMLTRGVLLTRRESNDAPPVKPQLWAFEFDELGLDAVRAPRSGEFPDLEVGAMTPGDRIADYLSSEGSSAAPDIADGIDLPAGTVRRILNSDHRFLRLVEGGKGRGSRSKWGLKAPEGLETP